MPSSAEAAERLSPGDPGPVLTGKRQRWLSDSAIDLLVLAAIGLLVQGFWASRLDGPTYMDAYYYASNGQRLATGNGFTEMVIWQFLDDPVGLPNPSHTYWMPLPSMLAAAGYQLNGRFSGAQLPFWLLGGLLPLLAYVLSRRLSGERWQAWAAALLTATGGYYAAFLGQTTTFSPFAWAGALCLLFLGLASRADRLSGNPNSGRAQRPAPARWMIWLAAGISAGLAQLTRSDGVLFLFVGLATWAIAIRKWRVDIKSSSHFRSHILGLVLLLCGYLLVMGGWFVRNWVNLGSLLPTAGVQSMFLTTYDDLFAYGRNLDLDGYLAWGGENILWSKLRGMWVATQTFIAIPGYIFLVPFSVIGWVNLYRRPDVHALLRPVTWYVALLFLTMSVVFTFPGIRGSLFHSSVALWPWSMPLAVAGLGLVVDWMARRMSHWRPARAKRNFSALFVIIALALSVLVSWPRTLPDQDPEIFRQIGEMVPTTAVVMVGNAPALNYHTGLRAISIPNEPVEVLLEAADRFHVTHVALDSNRPQPLSELYSGQKHSSRMKLIGAFEDLLLYELLNSAH